jgi:hypothetical protein
MGGTAVARTVCISPSVQLQPIECEAAIPDGDLRYERADFAVETVPVHAQVTWRMTEPDEARLERKRSHGIGRRSIGLARTTGYGDNLRKTCNNSGAARLA